MPTVLVASMMPDCEEDMEVVVTVRVGARLPLPVPVGPKGMVLFMDMPREEVVKGLVGSAMVGAVVELLEVVVALAEAMLEDDEDMVMDMEEMDDDEMVELAVLQLPNSWLQPLASEHEVASLPLFVEVSL